MRVADLDYELPKHLIAQTPAVEREASRLLVLGASIGEVDHRHVRDLPSLLPPRCLLVLNDTRVIPARLRGTRPTGGKVELLLLEPLANAGQAGQTDALGWRAMAKPAKALKPGMVLTFAAGLTATVLGRDAEGLTEVELAPPAGMDLDAALEQAGEMPLPPYIERPDGTVPEDTSRYQTVFAHQPGAVAAPTAGLHFSEALLDTLRAQGHELAYCTLHVGAGTFAPLKVDDLDAHPMHSERYVVPEATAEAIRAAKREGRPVIAVGTTVVRTLEAVHAAHGEVVATSGSTNLLIQPPYTFGVVDGLLTNFHLPRSTLLALVMARVGIERTRAAYAEAVRSGYRFFSYGDAMFIPPGLGARP